MQLGDEQQVNPIYVDSTNRYSELDLVDIIGFTWRWRRCLMVSLLAGGAIGVIVVNALPVPLQSRKYGINFSVPSDDPTVLQALPVALTAILNTPEGSRQFYQSLPELHAGLRLTVDSWIAAQQAGEGLIRGFEPGVNRITAMVEIERSINNIEFQGHLLKTLNDLIRTFNSRYVEGVQRLEQEQIESSVAVARLKADALHMFDQYSMLSPDMKRVVASDLIDGEHSQVSIEGLVFFLGSVNEPDAANAKAQLFERYQALLARQKRGRQEISARKRAIGLDIMVRLPLFDGVSAEKGSALRGLEPKSGGVLRLVLTLLMGMIAGGFVGVIVASSIDFLRHNKNRIANALSA